MSEERLKECYEIVNESWKLIRKYASQKQDDTYWNNLVNETSVLIQNHNSDAFAKDLVPDCKMDQRDDRQCCPYDKNDIPDVKCAALDRLARYCRNCLFGRRILFHGSGRAPRKGYKQRRHYTNSDNG